MNAMFAVLGMSGGELVLVVVAVLVLFGAKRIPEFAKGLGKGINEFKKASREVTDEFERSTQETHTPVQPVPRPPENPIVAQGSNPVVAQGSNLPKA